MAMNPTRKYCPKCNSEEVYVRSSINLDWGEATVRVECSDCGLVFFECYEYYGYKLDTCFDVIKET